MCQSTAEPLIMYTSSSSQPGCVSKYRRASRNVCVFGVYACMCVHDAAGAGSGAPARRLNYQPIIRLHAKDQPIMLMTLCPFNKFVSLYKHASSLRYKSRCSFPERSRLQPSAPQLASQRQAATSVPPATWSLPCLSCTTGLTPSSCL